MRRDRPHRRAWMRRTATAALPLVAFATVLWVKPMGLLLWARLRILTNIPRTAIAEPEANGTIVFPDPDPRPRGDALPFAPAGPAADSQGGAKSCRDGADQLVDP